MYTSEQLAKISTAKEECLKTMQPVILVLEVPFIYQGKKQIERRTFTYDFDARGIPCPKVNLQENGEVSIHMYRADPGIYLVSLDSSFQTENDKPNDFKRKSRN